MNREKAGGDDTVIAHVNAETAEVLQRMTLEQVLAVNAFATALKMGWLHPAALKFIGDAASIPEGV